VEREKLLEGLRSVDNGDPVLKQPSRYHVVQRGYQSPLGYSEMASWLKQRRRMLQFSCHVSSAK
jgi:hypothetical protein